MQEMVKKQPSGNLLFLFLQHIIKRVSTFQPRNNIKCICSANPHGREENRSATVSTSRTDLFLTLGKRGRACCNSATSRKAERMNAHQIRTKATNGAKPKRRRWKSVVMSCGCTLMGMVFGFEGRFVGCAHGTYGV